MVPRNADVTDMSRPLSRSSHSERQETRDKRLDRDVALPTEAPASGSQENANEDRGRGSSSAPSPFQVASSSPTGRVKRKRTKSPLGTAALRSGGRTKLRREEDGDAVSSLRLRNACAEACGKENEGTRDALSLTKRTRVSRTKPKQTYPSPFHNAGDLEQTFAKPDGAIAWFYTALITDPRERATAGKKFSDLLARGLWSYDELITALTQWAATRDSTGSPHRAIGFTDAVARSYIAAIRERERDDRRAEEAVTRRDAYERGVPSSVRPDRSLHRLNFGDALRLTLNPEAVG